MTPQKGFFAALFCLGVGAALPGATTYYVRGGAVGGDGLSDATAWGNFTTLNGMAIPAGTIIQIKGGTTVNGPLSLNASDGAAYPAAPITITSYGTGRGTISGGSSQHGIDIYNVANIVVDNVNFTAAGQAAGSKAGVHFYADTVSATRKKLYVSNCDLSGFGDSGIVVSGFPSTDAAVLSDISITAVSSHDNKNNGFWMWGNGTFKNNFSNLYIADSTFYSNTGYAATQPRGSGIDIANVNGALIEYSSAWGNGTGNTNPAGPVGMWCYMANNVVFQYCESYNNSGGAGHDGDGFDFDGGTTNSTIQYCYTHGNQGAGYLFSNYQGMQHSGNTIRYNVSAGDATYASGGYGAITIWSLASTDPFGANYIYNNVFYMGGTSKSTAPPIYFTNVYITNPGFKIWNNLMITDGTRPMMDFAIWDTTVFPTSSQALFQGNLYYNTSNYYTNSFKANPALSYSSLAAWQAAGKGQEPGGLGYQGDPLLTGPLTQRTVGNARNLASLLEYTLTGASPAIDRAFAITSTALVAGTIAAPGAHDFFGNLMPVGPRYDIGAHEYASSASPTPTATSTPSRTVTLVQTPTSTPSATASATLSPVYTPTASPTATLTPTRSPSFSPSPSLSSTGTATRTLTFPPTPSSTSTPDVCAITTDNLWIPDGGGSVIIDTFNRADGLQSLDSSLASGNDAAYAWWTTSPPSFGIGSIASVDLSITWSSGRGAGQGHLGVNVCYGGPGCMTPALALDLDYASTAAANAFQTQTQVIPAPVGGWTWAQLGQMNLYVLNASTGKPNSSRTISIDQAYFTIHLNACSSPTPTFTPGGSATASATASPSATASATASPTRSASPSPSPSASPTPSLTNSASKTMTPSSTVSGTPSVTATRSASPTPTGSPTPSLTHSASSTASASATPSATFSPSPSASPSPSTTASPTPSLTYSASRTATPSPTVSGTASVSATRSASPTPSDSPTPTLTHSASSTASASATPSQTYSASPTGSASATPSQTFSASPTLSASATSSATPSATISVTVSPSSSGSPTMTPSATVTATFSASPSASPSGTLTPSWTASASPSITESPSATGSITVTPTVSASFSPSRTVTATPSRSATPTRSSTVSPSPSASGTPTQSFGPTGSATPSASSTQVPSSPTLTATFSATCTATWMVSGTLTATRSATIPSTPAPSPTPTSTLAWAPSPSPGAVLVDGQLRIEAGAMWPNPAGAGGARLGWRLSGAADQVCVRAYSRAMNLAWKACYGSAGLKGWESAPVVWPEDLAAGVYFMELVAFRGQEKSEPVIVKVFWLGRP